MLDTGGDGHTDHTARRLIARTDELLGARLSGLEMQLQGVEGRFQRQYDILQKTLMALIERDNKEYRQQMNELALIRRIQRQNQLIQFTILLVIVISLSLWIGSRFL